MSTPRTSSHPERDSATPDLDLDLGTELPWPIMHLDEADDFGVQTAISRPFLETYREPRPPTPEWLTDGWEPPPEFFGYTPTPRHGDRQALGRVVKAMDSVEFDTDLFRLKNRVAHLEDQTLRMRIVLGTIAVWGTMVTGWMLFS